MSPTAEMESIEILGAEVPGTERVLTREALRFVALLVRRFGRTREILLARRQERQAQFLDGSLPDFIPETTAVRAERASAGDTRSPGHRPRGPPSQPGISGSPCGGRTRA